VPMVVSSSNPKPASSPRGKGRRDRGSCMVRLLENMNVNNPQGTDSSGISTYGITLEV
jgi:hypothetical protein